jgi:RNA polymerase sigma factor (sigma-70 family)
LSELTTVVQIGRRVVSSEQLAEHEGLVRWVVRQQWLGQLPFADALHEGRLGLWRALQGYDRSRGTRFSTYAVPAITHAVWRAVSQQHQAMRPLQSSNLSPASEFADMAAGLQRAELEAELYRLIARLPPRLSQVIVAHYGLDGNATQTFAEIGRTLGVTRQRVQQLHVTAVLWLAHPAHSLPLRHLLERNRRTDYRQTLGRQNQVARARRASQRGCRRGVRK